MAITQCLGLSILLGNLIGRTTTASQGQHGEAMGIDRPARRGRYDPLIWQTIMGAIEELTRGRQDGELLN
jgi:hypothetical protein